MPRSPTAPCPCGSGRSYKRCCRRFVLGEASPASPEALMRSRYTAYAVAAVDYIVATTDPAGPQHRADAAVWTDEIAEFCRATRFVELTIRAAELSADGERGHVEFHAQLTRAGEDVSFCERSEFRRVAGRWLYHDGAAVEP